MIRIGTSGWPYPPWRGVFYPAGLPHRRELEYLSSRLNSVEINGTFYSLQRPDSFRRWHDQAPDVFAFAVKGPWFVTHMKKLGDVDTPLANFFANGLLALDDKLGPMLCGSCRRRSATTASDWPHPSHGYRARPTRRRGWRATTTPASRAGR